MIVLSQYMVKLLKVLSVTLNFSIIFLNQIALYVALHYAAHSVFIVEVIVIKCLIFFIEEFILLL